MLGLPAYASSSDAVCSKENAHCVTVGQWEFSVGIGLGGRTNPIALNDDIPIFLMPTISYYGKRFFWQTDTIGYTLFESEHTQFNIIGTIGYDQTYFNDWGIGNFSIEGGGGGLGSGGVNSVGEAGSPNGDYSPVITPTPTPTGAAGSPVNGGEDSGPLSGGTPVPSPQPTPGPSPTSAPNPTSEPNLTSAPSPTPSPVAGPVDSEDLAAADIDLDDLHDRDMAGLAGFEYIVDSEYVSLGLQVLKDVTSVHDGLQVRLGLSTAFEHERSAYAFSLGAEWKDSDTLDYYYGIRASEVEDQRFVYTVESELSYYLKFDWRYRLSKHWELRSIFHHRQFGEAITNSPLVNDDSTTAIFIGGVYHF